MDYIQFLIEQFTFVQDNLPKGIEIVGDKNNDEIYGDILINSYIIDYTDGNKDELLDLLDEFRDNEFLPHFKDIFLMDISDYKYSKTLLISFLDKKKYENLTKDYSIDSLEFSGIGPLGNVYKDTIAKNTISYEVSVVHYKNDLGPKYQFWCKKYGIEFDFYSTAYLNVFLARLKKDPFLIKEF